MEHQLSLIGKLPSTCRTQAEEPLLAPGRPYYDKAALVLDCRIRILGLDFLEEVFEVFHAF